MNDCNYTSELALAMSATEAAPHGHANYTEKREKLEKLQTGVTMEPSIKTRFRHPEQDHYSSTNTFSEAVPCYFSASYNHNS